MKNLAGFLAVSVWGICSFGAFETAIYDGVSGEATQLATALVGVEPGTIIIVSEQHNFRPHHDNQRRVLNALALGRLIPRTGEMMLDVSVGMEFFPYTRQAAVDAYLQGTLSEEEMLVQVDWGANDFRDYRDQVLFPRFYRGSTVALNMPKAVTQQVRRGGLASLNAEHKALLPPDFQLGRASYFERFKEVMGGHPTPGIIENFFAAQSIWDDTMAWNAMKYVLAHPMQVLVIIVGDFHNMYGGGLPDRLAARGCQKLLTISQVNATEMNEEEIRAEILPHPKWGIRADYVWVIRQP